MNPAEPEANGDGLAVVDAQVHLWNDVLPEYEATSRPYRRIRPGTAAGPEPFGGDDLIAEMDAAGVDGAIVIPSTWGVDDLGFALEAARRHPGRLRVVVKLVPDAVDRSADLERLTAAPEVLGVRALFHAEPQRSLLAAGAFEWLWAGAQARGIPVMLQGHGSLPAIAEVAERHPTLRLTLDHFGLAPETGIGPPQEDRIEPSIDALIQLARYENVAVKASCGPNYVSGPYPFEHLHRHIRRIVESFGPQRVFWGSDLTRLRCSYLECATFLRQLPFLSATDLDWIMGRALREWFGWCGRTV